MSWLFSVCTAAIVAWRLHRASRKKAIAQRVVDLEVAESLIKVVLTDSPRESDEAIAREVTREMAEHGYEPRVISLVNVEYVAEVRRAENWRSAARHRRSEERKMERLREGSPYRVMEPTAQAARKRNLRNLLEAAGVAPEELGEKKTRRKLSRR